MTVLDVVNDPYARRYNARLKRTEFEKFKRTKQFKSWKNIQIRAQRYKCAYCKARLDKGNIVVHVDHVDPLYFEGKNDITNLVLACRRCNMKKWINNRITYPQWIIDNKHNHRVKEIKSQQRRQMRQLVDQELDEQLLNGELSWL